MASGQKRIPKPKIHRDERPGIGAPTIVHADKRTHRQAQREAKELEQELDDLLDEVDEVLEENAEEFVANFKQASGE